MSELSHYEKTGYLHDDFKIFHLKDTSMRPIDFHYHDFHKILIFRKGNISYNVEGRTYDLIPGDIVFVPAGTVHRPVLHSSEIYELHHPLYFQTLPDAVMIPTISHSA